MFKIAFVWNIRIEAVGFFKLQNRLPELGLQAATETTFLQLRGKSHSGLIINLGDEGRRYHFIDGVVFVQAQIPVYLSLCDASSH